MKTISFSEFCQLSRGLIYFSCTIFKSCENGRRSWPSENTIFSYFYMGPLQRQFSQFLKVVKQKYIDPRESWPNSEKDNVFNYICQELSLVVKTTAKVDLSKIFLHGSTSTTVFTTFESRTTKMNRSTRKLAKF